MFRYNLFIKNIVIFFDNLQLPKKITIFYDNMAIRNQKKLVTEGGKIDLKKLPLSKLLTEG